MFEMSPCTSFLIESNLAWRPFHRSLSMLLALILQGPLVDAVNYPLSKEKIQSPGSLRLVHGPKIVSKAPSSLTLCAAAVKEKQSSLDAHAGDRVHAFDEEFSAAMERYTPLPNASFTAVTQYLQAMLSGPRRNGVHPARGSTGGMSTVSVTVVAAQRSWPARCAVRVEDKDVSARARLGF